MVTAFAPKWPRLTSPAPDAVVAAETSLGAALERSDLTDPWSEFNHNVAGIFLLAIACRPGWPAFRGSGGANGRAALLAARICRIGVFLMFRSDTDTWPFGPIPFWEGVLRDSEILQHRLAAGLVLAVGLVESRARQVKPESRLPFLFPVPCLGGGVLLLTHSHSAFELRNEYLIQITHTAMGLCAVMMACGRWLELRIGGQAGRIAGAASLSAMLALAAILMFYREPQDDLNAAYGISAQAGGSGCADAAGAQTGSAY